jgi:hypothetical protein
MTPRENKVKSEPHNQSLYASRVVYFSLRKRSISRPNIGSIIGSIVEWDQILITKVFFPPAKFEQEGHAAEVRPTTLDP